MRKIKRGLACVAAGLLLIGLACGFWVDNRAEDEEAALSASQLVAAAETRMRSARPETEGTPEATAAPDGAAPQLDGAAPQLDDLMGVLSMPTISRTLPVQDSYNLKNLRYAPCRYTGEDGELSRLVICGHNYRSHFGPLNQLEAGDGLTLTDLTGAVTSYTVGEVTTIAGNDFAALEEGDWDLVLFTCTTSRVERVLVRCRES